MEDVSVVILSGGKSSRMGKDKATLMLKGQTFVEHLRENLMADIRSTDNRKVNCAEFLFSVRNEQDFPEIAIRHIADVYPGCGPLAGIHSGLKHASCDWVFVVACDTPFVTHQTVEELYQFTVQAGQDGNVDVDAVVPVEADGRAHVLCGLYHKRIFQRLEEELQKKNYRVNAVLSSLHTNYVPVSEFSNQANVFCNVNTPEAYEEVCR